VTNAKDLKPGITKAAEEAPRYYLVAWEPEEDGAKPEKLRSIEVSIKGRPEPQVRMQKGYLRELPAFEVR
jgi:hypothetical protein